MFRDGRPAVASYADAWIEIVPAPPPTRIISVASYADAWIEIGPRTKLVASYRSHPTRMRGLKFAPAGRLTRQQLVASYADAWIEIDYNDKRKELYEVASYADAWIEIWENGP